MTRITTIEMAAIRCQMSKFVKCTLGIVTQALTVSEILAFETFDLKSKSRSRKIFAIE